MDSSGKAAGDCIGVLAAGIVAVQAYDRVRVPLIHEDAAQALAEFHRDPRGRATVL